MTLPVPMCQRCAMKPAAWYGTDDPVETGAGQHVCWECFDRWRASPEGIVRDQALTAIQRMDRDPDDYLVWPWPELDAITGPMAPGQRPYLFAAFSGNGKTAFSVSAVERWTEAGVPGYIVPLETTPDQWRVSLACVRLGINPAAALSGRLKREEKAGDTRAREQRWRIADELRRQYDEWADVLHVSRAETVSRRTLEAEFKTAASLGCRYIVVDHIDHVEGDGRGTPVAESMAVNRDLPRLCQRYDLVAVVASQLNMDIAKQDQLSKYRPPRSTDLMFPAVKNQVANGIIGLHRVVRSDVDPELLARAKRGEVDPYREGVLKLGVMGVNVVKLAHQDGDAHEGARCELAVRHGQVMTQREADDLAARHGPPPTRHQHYDRPEAA